MGSLLSSTKDQLRANIHHILSKESVVCITSHTNLLLPKHIIRSKLKKLDGYSKTIHRQDNHCLVCKCHIDDYRLIASCDIGTLCYSCWRDYLESFLLEKLFLLRCLVEKDLCTLIYSVLIKITPIEVFDLYNTRSSSDYDVFSTVHQYVSHIRSIYNELIDLQLPLPSKTRVLLGREQVILYRWILGDSDSINLSHSDLTISVTEHEDGNIQYQNEYKTMYDALSHIKTAITIYHSSDEVAL